LAAIPGVHLWAGLLFFLSLLWFAAALVAAVEGALAVPTRRALLITIVSLVSHEVLHQGLRLFGLMG
jgi:hypothetical protein